nr:heparan-alpha-glucosaminide N-acetyltransferase domain-containing protein [Corynebacterium lactis]
MRGGIRFNGRYEFTTAPRRQWRPRGRITSTFLGDETRDTDADADARDGTDTRSDADDRDTDDRAVRHSHRRAPAPAAGAGESASRRRKAVAGGRLDYLDAVRAVAIIGMLITHLVQLSKVPDKVQFVFDGRASIVFAVLAGVSAVLLTRSVARRKGQADPGEMTSAGAMTLLKRGLLLYVICLIVAPLSVGPVVILGTYAVLMVLAIPLLYIRDTRILIALSAVSAVALPVLSYFLRSQVLPVNDAQGLVPGFTDFFSLGTMVASAQGLFFDGFYPVLTFAPFLMAGLVIGRVLTGALWRGGDVMKGLFATGSGLILLGYGTSIFVRTQTGYTQQRIDEVAQGAMSPEELNPDMVANMPPEMVEQMLHPTYNPFESQMGVTGLSDPRALLVAVPHSGSITEIIGGIGVATVLIAAMAFAFRFARRC